MSHKVLHEENVSRETFLRLEMYRQILLEWNERINLISALTKDDIDKRHIEDSLQLLPLIPLKENIIVDIGSGAGFPGMVLALAGYSSVHLIESDQRKIAFLREVLVKTQCSATLHAVRAEHITGLSADIVTARACAPLNPLLVLAFPFLHKESICLFLKGKNYTKEIEDTAMHWAFDHKVIPSRVDADGVILQLWNVAPL